MFQVLLQSFASQFAGWAMSATVAHDAVVTGECAIADGVEDAKFVGQCPCLLFVEPHQGRVQAELLVHSEVERRVEALDEAVSAVGIAAEISLSDTCDDVVDAMVAGIDGCNGDEEEIASGHEGRGVGSVLLLLCLDVEVLVRQAAQRAKLADEADVHAFPRHTGFIAELFCDVNLRDVTLPIAKAKRTHFVEVLEGPVEASRGVLST